MRALVLTSFEGPLGFVPMEVPDPEPGGEVLINVRAAGISFPDLLISRDRYQVKAELPFVAGQEVAGTVRSAPPGAGLRIGDRVWALLPASGGFSEIARAAPREVHPLPDALSFEEGAALGVNFMTAVFALRMRTHLASGETVLVLGGSGGLGTALLAVASCYGARTLACVSSAGKVPIAERAGADEVIVGYDFRERVHELTGGLGVDVVADLVGGDATLEAIRSCRAGGRVLILGFAGGSIAEIKVNRLLLRNVSLIGAGLGAMDQADCRTLPEAGVLVNKLIARGLRPTVGALYPLERGAQALAALEEREALAKLILTF